METFSNIFLAVGYIVVGMLAGAVCFTGGMLLGMARLFIVRTDSDSEE